MDILNGIYYIIDNKGIKTKQVNYEFNESEFLIYEVLRTTNGVLVFLENHLERLKNSLESIGLIKQYNEKEARSNLHNLLKLNSNLTGNVKFLCKPSGSKLIYASYYIPHLYPENIDYKIGIKLSSCMIERTDPQIKQIKVNNIIKKEIQNKSTTTSAYEILLINKYEYITEGSRSNFFLIKENTIFSAPENLILPGITRKHVLEIAKNNNIEIIERKIKIQNIKKFEAAFISGTSPKVIPVRSINNSNFRSDHPIIKLVMEEFNKLYDSYISSRIRAELIE